MQHKTSSHIVEESKKNSFLRTGSGIGKILRKSSSLVSHFHKIKIVVMVVLIFVAFEYKVKFKPDVNIMDISKFLSCYYIPKYIFTPLLNIPIFIENNSF